MRTTIALLVLATSLLAAAPSVADEDSARAKLSKDNVAPTPEAFLHEAVSGNAEHVKLLLEIGIDPSVKDVTGMTALWLSVEFKNLEVLKTLLAAGVKPDEKNAPVGQYGKTIVFGAVDTGIAAYVRALVDAGADAKRGNDYEVTPLGEAARNGNDEMCEILMKGGADANAESAGFPILFGPILENHLTTVKLLLKAGAKLGSHKEELLAAATSDAMREILNAAE